MTHFDQVMIRPFSGPRYHENKDACPEDKAPCVLCGKPVKLELGTTWVHVIDGGARFRPADMPDSAIDLSGDMGVWPLGSECKRKLDMRTIFHTNRHAGT